MATESELCVDELLRKLENIDKIKHIYDNDNAERENLIVEAKDSILDAQAYIDNNRAAIPSYCLKKASDAIKSLESKISQPVKSKLQFKFKTSPPNREKNSGKSTINSNGINSNEQIVDIDRIFGFRNRLNETLSLSSKETEFKDISLVDLIKCDVKIYGLANTVYIRNLVSTNVTICLAARAITVNNCKGCNFKLVCQQLRIDLTTQCTFEIFTSARSMIESSSDINFREFKLSSLGDFAEADVAGLFKQANYDRNKNNWRIIDDFDWLSNDKPSDNFKILE